MWVGAFPPPATFHYKHPSVKTTHQEKLRKLFLTGKCTTMFITCCSCQRKVGTQEVSRIIFNQFLDKSILITFTWMHWVFHYWQALSLRIVKNPTRRKGEILEIKWKCWVLFRGSVTSTRLATPPFRAGNGHLFKSESCLLKESFKRAININSLINNAAFHSLSIWKQPRNRPPFSFTHPWSCWGGRRGKFLSGAWGGAVSSPHVWKLLFWALRSIFGEYWFAFLTRLWSELLKV